MSPYTTLKKINLRLLALDNYTTIINFRLLQNNEEYDGMYEIKFNENLECIYFKS